MFFEKSNIIPGGTLIPNGVCNSCTYNSGVYSVNVEPNKLKEASYMSRYNTMRNIENQGKGCPS
jgi:hypothetical protein